MNALQAKRYRVDKFDSVLLILLGSSAFSFLVGRAVESLNAFAMPVGYAFGIAAITYMLWGYTRVSTILNKEQRLFGIAGIAVYTIAIFGFQAAPAHAQFLQGAEALFESVEGIDETLVDTLFTVLRIAFVIAFVISLLPAFNAARDGDDWKSLAKAPVLAAVLIAVADVVIGLIAGTGGAA
ncbi:MAG: hypothetical protein AAGF01_07760 [Cyanobacteria bacterium P01_G01_bin.38]